MISDYKPRRQMTLEVLELKGQVYANNVVAVSERLRQQCDNRLVFYFIL